MKKSIKFYLSLFACALLSVATISSCSDDDDIPLRNDNKVVFFRIKLDDKSVSATINHAERSIKATLPYGTDVTALAPEVIVSDKATVIPASDTEQDFTDPVIYIVTAEDGTTANYTATMEVAKSTESAILEFRFAALNDTTTTVNEDTKVITANVDYGTDLTALVPTIRISPDATVTPPSGQPQDFTESVIYTVTAQDGTSAQEYTVRVLINANTENDITKFEFDGVDGQETTIDLENDMVTISVPFATNLTNLVPVIELSDNATVTPNAGVAQDFTEPVTYKVAAENGDVREYTVKVEKQKNTERAIKTFAFQSPAVTGVVNEETKTVTLEVPFGTNVAQLTPVITISENGTINPASGAVQNFTQPVTYTVTSESGETQAYTVRVTIAKNTENKITEFKFEGITAEGVINEENSTITVLIPASADVTRLRPSVTASANATVEPTPGAEVDFTDAVIFTVTSESGASRTYTVTVTKDMSGEKAITEFKFEAISVIGVIDEDAKTITVTVPAGTDITTLVPTITVSENATVDPASAVVQNFLNPVVYTVTAQDESTVQYTVTVTVPAGYQPVISAIDAADYVPGATIEITGTFAPVGNVVAIERNGVSTPLVIQAESATSITAVIPSGALVGTYKMTVTSYNRPSDEFNVIVVAPTP